MKDVDRVSDWMGTLEKTGGNHEQDFMECMNKHVQGGSLVTRDWLKDSERIGLKDLERVQGCEWQK